MIIGVAIASIYFERKKKRELPTENIELKKSLKESAEEREEEETKPVELIPPPRRAPTRTPSRDVRLSEFRGSSEWKQVHSSKQWNL